MTTETQTVLTDSTPSEGQVAPEPKTESVETKQGAAESTPESDEVKSAIPEKYDLKLPDGSMFSEAEILAVAEDAKALGLSQENAQKLLETRNNDRAKYVEGQKQVLSDTVQAWAKALPSDPEIAGKDGTEYQANIARAKLALNKFGSSKLREELDKTGFGNHPELVRLMVRVGKAMREDSFHTGDNKGGAPTGDPDQVRADKFYSTSKG